MSSFVDVIAVPFGAVLRVILQLVHSYGLAIILFTILAKVIILPFHYKSKKSMLDIQKLQPKIAELQKKYGTDKNKYNEAVSKLYEKEGVSPAGSCLPTLLMFPIMIGLYYVIVRPLSYLMNMTPLQISQVAKTLGMDMTQIIGKALNLIEIRVANAMNGHIDVVKSIAPNAFEINFNFLGINLASSPTLKFWTSKEAMVLILVPILSGITAFLLSWYTMRMQKKVTGNPVVQTSEMRMMQYTMPLLSVWFTFMFPAGVGLYWIVSNIFGIAQEYLLAKVFARKEKKAAEELAEKQKRREARLAREAEEKRLEAQAAAQQSKNKSGKKTAKKPAQEEAVTEETDNE